MADHRRQQISAALDGEAPMPNDLDADEEHFVRRSLELRAAVRITEAHAPPDVTGAVLDGVRSARRAQPMGAPLPRRPIVLAAAAAFVVAAVAGALAVRPGGPAAPVPASAGLSARVLAGQRAITSFDAQVHLTEHRVHPEVPMRRLSGSLHYRAPERLTLRLRQQGDVAAGWPRNDVDLVLEPGRASLHGLGGCPVEAQPACLQPRARLVEGLPPFAPTWISPLDLIIPTDAFLPSVSVPAEEAGGRVSVRTTVARVDRLVEGLSTVGAIRAVHATDEVTLTLDSERLTLRSLRIDAADNLARTTWAATNGYHDPPGSEVLRLALEPTVVAGLPAPVAGGEAIRAGFVDRELQPAWPAPPGFELHRTGILEDGGPRTEVYAYSDGRAWLRIDVTDDWDAPRLFGSLGAVVRAVPVGDGVGYTDPAGTRLSLHTAERDVLVSGSVPFAALVDAAAQVIEGDAIDDDWTQARHPERIPDGALVPAGEFVATLADGTLTIAVGGPGSTGFVLVQEPAVALPPPVKGDVVDAPVRGVAGRYSPRLGTLTWLEDGWAREIRSDALDLRQLVDVADALVAP